MIGAVRMFCARMFAARYWPKLGAEGAAVITPVTVVDAVAALTLSVDAVAPGVPLIDAVSLS